MDVKIIRTILHEYDSRQAAYGDLANRTKNLIDELLREQDIQVLSVAGRLKERKSLEGKLLRVSASYSGLGDITDVAGVRIITFLADDVDRIGHLVEQEFRIDRANSIDKRALLDTDKFGYLSLHYVAQLSEGRASLTENTRFGELKVEIQVRSILQHAWAEIEHDLDYKAAVNVPQQIRRRFLRLAGLFELADEEFIALRDAMKAIPLSPSLYQLPLDIQNLAVFVDSDSLVSDLDRYIASKMSAVLVGGDVENRLPEKWRALKIMTIGDLRHEMIKHAPHVRSFARDWLHELEPRPYTYRGISLFFLRYVLLSELQDRAVAKVVLADIGVEAERDDLISRVFAMTRARST